MSKILVSWQLLHSPPDCTSQKLQPTLVSFTFSEGDFMFIVRLLYSIFYKKKGGALNKGRIAGVAITYIGFLGAIGVFTVNFYKNYWTKWFCMGEFIF